MTTAAELDLSSLDRDPRLFLYTSLTAGSSHIITATSRMETILKANKIPFLAVDLATDDKCRRLWQRRGGAKKKLPGLVKEGYIIGDLEEVEEWNEFGELKENIGPVPPSDTAPPGARTGVSTAPPLSHNVTTVQSKLGIENKPQPGFDKTKAVALPGAEEMAAIHKAKAAAALAAKTPVPSTAAAAVPTSTEPESSKGKTEGVEKDMEELKVDLADVTNEQKANEDGAEKIQKQNASEPEAKGEKTQTQAASEPEAEVEKTQAHDAGEPEVKAEKSAHEPEAVDETTQKQSAAEPEAAGKSVED